MFEVKPLQTDAGDDTLRSSQDRGRGRISPSDTEPCGFLYNTLETQLSKIVQCD